MDIATDKNETTEWPNDVLKRKPYAEFLTRYLVSRTNNGNRGTLRPFTLAIDAEWGHGKTFFVEHWATDLRSGDQQHITLIFDAWKSDYVADPVVSFMSEFKACIDECIQRSGAEASLRKRATDAVQTAFKEMRRAIIPAGKVVLTSLVKKASGITISEILQAGETDENSNRSTENISEAGIAAMNKGLDTFFDRALQEQSERRQAIGDFKTSMALALKTLSEDETISLPMFVFIDELDRCRPDFAITLLEGAKHLFDIPGVCFVVTTNIRQLSASVKSIYGQDFDGHGYLKRLFDVEFSLPEIDQSDYAKLLIQEFPELNERAALGLPPTGFSNHQNRKFEASDVLAWVAEAFSLDLRSLRKIVETVVAASTGVPKDRKIYLLWMTVLVTIRHKSPELFDRLNSYNTTPINRSEFTELWGKIANRDNQRQINSYGHLGIDNGKNIRVSLGQIAQIYYAHSFTDLKHNQFERNGYPESVLDEIYHNEMPTHYRNEKTYPPSTASYFNLVRTAGHIITD